MAEDNQAGTNEGQEDEKVETVTIEQFQELKVNYDKSLEMFEALKKSQSGADSKVSELQKLLKQKDDDNKTDEQKFIERLAAVESELESTKAAKQSAILKGLAIQMLGDKSIKAPTYLDRLIGKDAEETEANITAFIEEQLERELKFKDEFAKNNGRTITKGKNDVKTLDDYTDDELKSMSDSEFEKVQERSRKK